MSFILSQLTTIFCRASKNENGVNGLANRAKRKTEGRLSSSEQPTYYQPFWNGQRCAPFHSDKDEDIRIIPGCGVARNVFVGTEPSHHSTFPLELQFHQGASVQELDVDDEPFMAATNTEVCREHFQVISDK